MADEAVNQEETRPPPSARPVSVLLVVDDDVFDRLGSAVRHLCVGMLDEAVSLTVLARTSRSGIEHSTGPSRVVTVPQRRWPWSRRRLGAEEALSLIGGTKPQIVHCLSAHLAEWCTPWIREWGCGLVVHLTDLMDAAGVAGLAGSHDLTAIAATGVIREALLKNAPGLADRVRAIPLGIPADAEPACLARPERVPAVLVTTPLTADCGLHLVLKAMEGVVKGGQEAHLFVLASGPREALFRRLVRQLDLRSHVTFAGGLGDWSMVRQAMRGADFYILPGERRRFNVSTLTAMAVGLGVLAPTGTIGDYLVDGVTAGLFDPQNPRELGEKWAMLLNDRSNARKIAYGALDYIRTYHQASAMVSRIAEVYREARPD